MRLSDYLAQGVATGLQFVDWPEVGFLRDAIGS